MIKARTTKYTEEARPRATARPAMEPPTTDDISRPAADTEQLASPAEQPTIDDDISMPAADAEQLGSSAEHPSPSFTSAVDLTISGDTLSADAELALRLQQEEDLLLQEHQISVNASATLAAELQAAEWQDAQHAAAAASASRDFASPPLMEGQLEKKPVRSVETNLSSFTGWRVRRVVLREHSIEWEPLADEEEPSPPRAIQLDGIGTRVRAAGDAGDDHELCLTVDTGSEVLVLRAAESMDRDRWLRTIGRCLEKLKAAAFDDAVQQAAQRLEMATDKAERRMVATCEGISLLMGRFYSSCAVSMASDEEADTAELDDLATALTTSLLTQGAEERLLAGKPAVQSEEEKRELQLFPWQPDVALALEEVTATLVQRLAQVGGRTHPSIADVAAFFAQALWAERASSRSALGAALFDTAAGGDGAAVRAPPSRWLQFQRMVFQKFMLRVLDLAAGLPAEIDILVEPLTDLYDTLPTSAEQDGLPSVLAARGVRCELLRRFAGSTTKPLLLHIETKSEEPDDDISPAADDCGHSPLSGWYRSGTSGVELVELAPTDGHAMGSKREVDVRDGSAVAAADAGHTDSSPADSSRSCAAAAPGAAQPATYPPHLIECVAPSRFFFKVGDDLRQDQASMLLLCEMNAIWASAGARCFTCTYRIYPTDDRAGFFEALSNAVPVRDVGEFTYSRLLHDSAVGAFTAGFVLGLADRHQDNMLVCGPGRELLAHIDFGYVAGKRPWFDANLLPIPERFKNCLVAAGEWNNFVNDIGFAFAILQAKRAELCAVATAFAEPLAPMGFPGYINGCLASHTPDGVRSLVEAAVGDIARRFKNLHHKLQH